MRNRKFWKVCKMLANEERTDVLRRVMSSMDEEGLPVGQIADAVRIGQSATSIYLSQLQDDCGLVTSSRAGRYCLYRAAPDTSDVKALALFQPLVNFFRKESTQWTWANGDRPAAPAFLSVLPALSNAMRVKLLGFVRDSKRTTRVMAIKGTGLSDINVRRHLECIESCGLTETIDEEITWHEPTDSLSRTFIDLSLS